MTTQEIADLGLEVADRIAAALIGPVGDGVMTGIKVLVDAFLTAVRGDLSADDVKKSLAEFSKSLAGNDEKIDEELKSKS